MEKPKNYDNTTTYNNNNLMGAVLAIDPDKMKMTRDEALSLRAAMKNCGFSREDFEKVMKKSDQDKGTMYAPAEWDKVTGISTKTGKKATEQTIYKFARRSGWTGQGASSGYSYKPESKKEITKTLTKEEMQKIQIEVIIDSEKFAEKPTQQDAKEIRHREKAGYEPAIYSTADFIKSITSGQTFRPACTSIYYEIIDGKAKKKYVFVKQQLFVVDIDNEKLLTDANGATIKDQYGKQKKGRIENPLTPEKAIEICKSRNIMPFFIYETFSSKNHRNDTREPYKKFRLCFLLTEPLDAGEANAAQRLKVTKYFMDLFKDYEGAVDTSTTDPARLIFGTDEKSTDALKLFPCVIDKKALFDKIREDEEKTEEDDSTQKLEVKSVDNYLSSFKENRLKFEHSIKTGFKMVDRALSGGMIDGLYIMAAQTGTGKSAIASILAQNIAAAGVNVLYYALEMGVDEFIARGSSAISKEENNKPVAYGHMLNDMYDERIDDFVRLPYSNYERYVEEYSRRYGQRLHIVECGINQVTAKTVCESARKFKKEHEGEQIIVFVDYLQILSGEEGERDIFTASANAVKTLAAFANQEHAPVFLISSVPKDSNNLRITENSFKNSNDIAFTGGILIGWNWEDLYENGTDTRKDDQKKAINECNERGYRVQTFEVLKNRNGQKGSEAKLYYYPAYNYITDIAPADTSKEKEAKKTEETRKANDDLKRQILDAIEEEIASTKNSTDPADVTNREEGENGEIRQGLVIECIVDRVAVKQHINANHQKPTREYKDLERYIKKALKTYGTVKKDTVFYPDDNFDPAGFIDAGDAKTLAFDDYIENDWTPED